MPQKADVLGVGRKKYDAHADQWWARAFDDTLRGLSVTAEEITRKTEIIVAGSDTQVLQMKGGGGAKWIGQRGLYGNFVKGESLIGTLKSGEKDHAETTPQSKDKVKQMRDDDDLNIAADMVGTIKRSERSRWHEEGNVSECSKLIDLDAIQVDLKNVGTEQRCEEKWEAPRITETNAQRRQRKREKKAKRALKPNENCEMPEQYRATARTAVPTSGRP